jgi:hypothetical protein
MKVIWLDRSELVLSSDINLKIKNKNTKRSNEKVSCIRAVLKKLKKVMLKLIYGNTTHSDLSNHTTFNSC